MNRTFTFPDALTILFIYLKMTEQIAWSWWFVLLPLWLPILVDGIVSAWARKVSSSIDDMSFRLREK